MGDLRYEGNWDDVKKRLMEKYPSLTEKDFEDESHEEKLLNHLSQKTGAEPDEMRRIIREI